MAAQDGSQEPAQQRQCTTTSRYAFATLLTTDEYLPAALVVAHSLRLVHSQSSSLSAQDREALGDDGGELQSQLGTWPSPTPRERKPNSSIDLVAIVTPETLSIQSIRSLLAVYDRVVGVETLGIESILAMQQAGQITSKGKERAFDGVHGVAQSCLDNLALLDRPDLGTERGAALTKLHAWRLTDYEKVLFLDADTLVLQPIAHLFRTAHAFAAAPDTGWPDIFNSGVMLLTPSDATFEAILQLAAESGSWDGADQGLINEYFGGEVGSGAEGRGGGWSRLAFTYNTTALGGYTYAPAFARYGNNVKVAHFIGADKPWRTRISPTSGRLNDHGKSGNLSARWWAVFQGYYPSQPPTPVSASSDHSAQGSDVEVRITERGVEIIERPRPKAFQVPVFQSAWDSVAGSAGSRGLTVEELRRGFSNRFHPLSGGESQGMYDSLPLFGRFDLLPPKFVRPVPNFPQVASTEAYTDGTTPKNSQSESKNPPSTPSLSQSWDATIAAPPQDSTPAAFQMRNPPDTYFTNVWDKPPAELTREEKERRRQFLNPNLRFEGGKQEQPFGYIPPEAREIHTFSHLGAKPDETLLRPVFPWEERQTGHRRHGSATRIFPEDGTNQQDKHRTRTQSSDFSVGGGGFDRVQATRRWDDHAVYASSQGQHSASLHADSASLVARYANVWDTEDAPHGRPAAIDNRAGISRSEDNDRQHDNRRLAQMAGRRSRRGTRSGGGQGGNGGGNASSRPSSTYIPNVYDDYAPAPRAPFRRSADFDGSNDDGHAPAQPHSNLATAMMGQQAAPNPSQSQSLDDSMYGEEGSGVYDRTMSRLGRGTGLGGQGDVEASSSWTAHLSDLVRLGDQPGSGAGPRSRGAPAAFGSQSRGPGVYRRRRHGEEDDGDDETSSDESRGSASGVGGDSASSRYSVARPHPQLSLSDHSNFGNVDVRGTGPAPRAPESVVSSTGGSGYVTANDHLTVPDSSAYSSNNSGNEDFAREREGPGYMRKAQANSFVRSHMTPRSPRHGHHPLLGASTTGAGVTPSTTIAVGSHSVSTATAEPSESSSATRSPSPPSEYQPAHHPLGAGVISAAPALTGRARIRPDKKKEYGPSAEYGYGEGWLG